MVQNLPKLDRLAYCCITLTEKWPRTVPS